MPADRSRRYISMRQVHRIRHRMPANRSLRDFSMRRVRRIRHGMPADRSRRYISMRQVHCIRRREHPRIRKMQAAGMIPVRRTKGRALKSSGHSAEMLRSFCGHWG